MSENITKILHSIRRDNWGQKLKNIKNAIEKYDEARTGQSSYSSDEIIKCLNDILPTYWDVFHTHNTARRRNGELHKRDKSDETRLPTYHIGIFLVGYSSLPIALSLAEIQPTEQIYFLYSQDTKGYLAEIFERLSAMLNGSNKDLLDLVEDTVLHNLTKSLLEIKDPSDPVSTFKRIKEIINKIDDADNKRIALDLTGGKKTMLGGGYTAGAIWASRWSGSAEAQKLKPFCDMYYIDSKQYDPIQGSPVPGTEFLNRLENPYAVYNVESDQQARKLFEKHNYEAAVNLWDGVRNTLGKHNKRYTLETEFRQAVNQYRMAKCYSLWDSFDYSEAKKNKGEKGTHDKNWGYFENHVHDPIDVLNILSGVTDKSSLFRNEKVIVHCAVDRYQNGMRRKESGKLEDAIVRFAQVIEMICAYRIYRLAQDDHFVTIGSSPTTCELPATERWEFKNLINQLFKRNTSTDVSGRRTCMVKDDKKMDVRNYGCIDIKQITDVIQPRNDFMHFNNPHRPAETENNTEKLRELAYKFLEKFLGEYCSRYLTLDKLLELHRFRQLTE